jgi:mono/diheme cytochrome c family protein
MLIVHLCLRNGLIALLLAGLLLGSLDSLAVQSADEGETLFQQKCAACHTVGGGPLAGPDLQGVTAQRDREWLTRWLAEPDQMLAEGDPIATELLADFNNVPMPNLGLSETEVWALIAYLESQGGAAEVATAESVPASELSAGNPATGRALFTGKASLLNDGPACMSCHNIAGVEGLGGGALGPDLTPAFAKYGGDAGMAAVLTDLPFPTMQPVYGERPLTAEEQADLRAFLQAAGEAPTTSVSWPLAGLAAGGFVVLMGVSQVVWRRRLRGVRRFLKAKRGRNE